MDDHQCGSREITVLLPVYHGDKPEWLLESWQSIVSQTCSVNSIKVLVDGPVPSDLHSALREVEADGRVEVLRSEVNRGLAANLNMGLQAVETQFTARLDADDVWLPSHACLVAGLLRRSSSAAIAGAHFESRSDDLVQTIGRRVAPIGEARIRRAAKFRTPINHPTIVFRTEIIRCLGGYRTDVGRFEDWALALTVLRAGHQIVNLDKVTLLVRSGDAVLERRSGLPYAVEEIRALKTLSQSGLLTPIVAAVNGVFRFPLRLLPRGALRLIYQLMRKRG